MALEKCQICGDLSTPYFHVKEGHACQNCMLPSPELCYIIGMQSALLYYFKNQFNEHQKKVYNEVMERIEKILYENQNDTMERS